MSSEEGLSVSSAIEGGDLSSPVSQEISSVQAIDSIDAASESTTFSSSEAESNVIAQPLENQAYTISRDALVNQGNNLKGKELQTPQEKSLDFYAKLYGYSLGSDGTFARDGKATPIITGGSGVIGESLYIVKGADGKWQAAAKDTANAVILQQLNGKTTLADGSTAFVGVAITGEVINDLSPQTVLDADLISESDNLISQCSEPTQQLLRARMEAIKQGRGENPTAVDKSLIKEAAVAEHQILSESLYSGAQIVLKEKTISPNATADQTAEIQRYNDRREALLQKLQNNIVVSPDDMSEFLSLYSPDSLHNSILEIDKQINDKLQQYAQLQNTPQGPELNKEIDALRKEKMNMEASKKFFEDPNKVKGFFNLMPKLTPEEAATINKNLSEGKIDESLEQMVEAKIKQLPPDQQEKAKKRMEQLKKLGIGAGGIGLALILVMIMEATKQQ